ncbi:MAG: hypothetical protein AAJB65_00120 [Candidatus Hodgkinia cicadicola]
MNSDLNKIKTLRKLTGIGIMRCRQILNECSGELAEALQRAQLVCREFKGGFEGSLYLACIRTRFGICLFKLYANSNIYNNKFVWNLRQLLNHILSSLKYDLEVVLNSKQIEGITIKSCVFLKLDSNTYSVYYHDKVCDFIWKKGVLLLLSAFSYNKCYLRWLGMELCKQILFNVVVNNNRTLENLLQCAYIADEKLNVAQLLELFQSKFKCLVSLNCALIIC